jgi:hypothetical protein
MVYFQTKNPDLGKNFGVLQWELLVYFTSIFWLFCLFSSYFAYFLVILYIFPVLVCCSKNNLATLIGMRFFRWECNLLAFLRLDLILMASFPRHKSRLNFFKLEVNHNLHI